jgi:hypothetical protein
METQPSEVSLNNARRILAQIENLRDTTGAPTLRKMWTDGTISYEFTVDEAHSRIRVWGEDLSFTGFLFTYPEAGFWGVGYKKETPKYKKNPPPKILAGELDWQGIGGKTSWHGLSRYFAYTTGGFYGIPTLMSKTPVEDFTPRGYRYEPFDYNNATKQYGVEDNDGKPYIYKDGKRICTIVLPSSTGSSVTCAIISPDKKKMLIGFSGSHGPPAPPSSYSYVETFFIIPAALAVGDINHETPGVLYSTSRRYSGQQSAVPEYDHAFPAPSEPYVWEAKDPIQRWNGLYYPPQGWVHNTDIEHQWPNLGGMWRFNASASIGYGERRGTRQRIDVEWTDDNEAITITAGSVAWMSEDKAVLPPVGSLSRFDITGPDIAGTYTIYNSPSGSYDIMGDYEIEDAPWVFSEAITDSGYVFTVYTTDVYRKPDVYGRSARVTFCDFDWDRFVEGSIEASMESGPGTESGDDMLWTSYSVVKITIDGAILHATEATVAHVYNPYGTADENDNSISGVYTYFHWVDLRNSSLSIDVQTSTGSAASVTENKTFIDGVLVPTTAPVAGPAFPARWGLPWKQADAGSREFNRAATDTFWNFYVGGYKSVAASPLPYGGLFPFGTGGEAYEDLKDQPRGSTSLPYVHHSGLGVAETGIKVYYLSSTEKRCVWGIANLPSSHLNEVQTYTYGSDDPATAEQLKGVGADGLLLNIYVV